MFATEHTRGWSAFDIVVLAGSLGGMGACRAVVSMLPPEFPAAVVFVQHRAASSGTATVDLVGRSTELPVVEARDGAAARPGTLYVAPAGAQLLVDEQRRFSLAGAGRCLADPLLQSVAAAYGERAIAVVLTGRLSDGAAGVAAVKRAGGRVLVQEPATAVSGAMPLAAMATGYFDLVLEPAQIGSALVALVSVRGAAELFAVRAHPWQTAIA